MEITDKLGVRNLVVGYLSGLDNRESGNPLRAYFPDKTLYATTNRLPWFADIVDYVVTKTFSKDLSRAQKEKIRAQSKYYIWDEPYLWKFCGDQIIRRCIDDSEFHSILTFHHSSESGGHFGPKRMHTKFLNVDFIGLIFLGMLMNFTKDAKHIRRQEIYLEGFKWLCIMLYVCKIFDA